MVNFVEIFAGAAAFSTVVAAGGYGGYGSPSYEAEKPHYEAEKPEYQPKEPAYEAPKPEYKPEEPSYDGPKYGPGYQPGYPTKSYYPTTMRTTTSAATTTAATTTTISTTTTTSATTTTTTAAVVPTPYNVYIGSIITDAISELLPAIIPTIGDAAFVANDAELAQDLLTFGSFFDTDVTADVFFSSPNPETGDGLVLFDRSTEQYALANLANPYPTTTEGETAYYVFFTDAASAVEDDSNLFVTVAQNADEETLDLSVAFPLGDGIASINVLSVCQGESLDEVLVISSIELEECTRIGLNYINLVGDDN
ncbi:hypothetical protein CBER1_07836 [Cercospora berteroae]|uniref:Uncharacterized protein n=1 Tax=Cercospora berteroae TaxID=357750 RepID=A0A2S6BU85_9PEZI|nr:hypothetical protein CBER1_07836 [Cercospora berteroae]